MSVELFSVARVVLKHIVYVDATKYSCGPGMFIVLPLRRAKLHKLL